MTEYIALVFVCVAVMYFLIEMSSRLSDNYDPLKMFLITVSMVIGAITLHLGGQISIEQGASAGVQNALGIIYWVWIVVTSLVFTYFLIYLVIRAWNALQDRRNDKNRVKLYDEENN